MRILFCAWILFVVAACGGNPDGKHRDPVEGRVLSYQRGDLATAGLGIEGLHAAPPETSAGSPRADELRRLAVHTNYRALVDVTEAGGFTRLYGPTPDGVPVPGHEYWALGRLPDGASHVMVLQVPAGFPGERACLVAAPASGSRGPLGAIGTAADWGLRRGCAVVHTDKGAGPWLANLPGARAYSITGRRERPEELAAVEPFSRRDWPGTADIAMKHAHSGRNPEARWGDMVLDSIRFAVERLAGHHPDGSRYRRDELLVLAASVSNGGAAVLKAAEADDAGWIDGVVAAEPNVYVPGARGLKIEEGGTTRRLAGLPLYAYASAAALFEPCATLAPAFRGAPLSDRQAMLKPLLEGRCRALAAAGLVDGDGIDSMARSALRALDERGLHPAAREAQVFNTLANLWGTIGFVYANAHGRFGPDDRLCGLGLRAFDGDGRPVEADAAKLATVFGTGSGVPPTAGIEIALVEGGTPVRPIRSAGDDGPDYGFDAMHCLYRLWKDTGERGRRVRRGVAETAVTGDPGDRPALLLHGRSDALVWVDHASRAYYAANRSRFPERSGLRYMELTNVQHFDTLLSMPGFAARFVPMHVYFERALDAMYAHLTAGEPLPPSQVIHTTPRQAGDDGVEPLQRKHVPPAATGKQAKRIRWKDDTLTIPQ